MSLNHKSKKYQSRLRAFIVAFRGIYIAFNSQVHMKIHLVAALLVVLAGFFFQITEQEWVAIVICIALVFAAETGNSAIEELCDKLDTSYDNKIRNVKDMASGMVLMVSIGASIVGIIIFWKYFF